MNKWVKYGAMAVGAYVLWKVLNGAKLSELLSLQSSNGGSEGKANTTNVGGKAVSLANSPASVSTGIATGGDGSATAQMLDQFWTKQTSGVTDSGGPIAPGNPANRQSWEM